MVIRTKPSLSEQPSGKWSCGVCGKGVGQNSILCTQCNKWIHKECSGVKGSLESCKNFQFGKYLHKVASIEETDTEPNNDIGDLESVDTFCHLGDMLSAGGGVVEA